MHIKEIKITGLFGRNDYHIPFNPRVNVIAGDNGCGKSTLLLAIRHILRPGNPIPEFNRFRNIEITLDDGRTIDISNSKEKANPVNIPCVLYARENQDSIASLYDDCDDATIMRMTDKINAHLTDKQMTDINHFSDGLNFIDMSDGEKQLVKVFAAAAMCREDGILLLDNPDEHLHIDIQEKLIQDLLDIHPGMQIVMATHSPGIIIDGWQNHVLNMNDFKQ